MKIEITVNLSLFMILSFVSLETLAYDYNCHETSRARSIESVCKGRTISPDRTRNFKRNTHTLACSSNTDHYIRRPQAYDFDKWQTHRNAGQHDKAWEIRQSLPDIKWKGHVPYSVIEVWKWEECSLGTSGPDCGYDQVCEDVTVSNQTCDSNGNCTTTTSTEQQCHDEPKTCYYDQVRSETWHCSNEIMKYSARFERPTESEWNMSSHEFAAFIPNKYDLMPGEIEDVQILNTTSGMFSGLNTTLSPKVEIGNAWNKYNLKDISGDTNVRCLEDTNYEIDVVIHTKERDTTKASPNAFDLPVNMRGKSVSPIVWETVTKDGRDIKVRPKKLIIMDKSAAVVKAVSKHSRINVERETLKAKLGKNGNTDGMDSVEAMKLTSSKTDKSINSFFKSNIIRVRMEKNRKLVWNTAFSNRGYSSDGESVIASTNVLSKIPEVRMSDVWGIDLVNDIKLYAFKTVNDGRGYTLNVSMYQKGVPFYQQKCADNSDQKNCFWRRPLEITHRLFGEAGSRWIENKYFSDELIIPFYTDYGHDGRSILQRMNDMIDFKLPDFIFQRKTSND